MQTMENTRVMSPAAGRSIMTYTASRAAYPIMTTTPRPTRSAAHPTGAASSMYTAGVAT